MDNNQIETDLIDDSQEVSASNKKVVIAGAIVAVMIGMVSFYLYTGLRSDTRLHTDSTVLDPEYKETRDAIRSSLLADKPENLQNLLLEDLKSGVNDEFTKAHAYFVTHRFYDNGGDIYEIFNYINTYPELSFLKEAEEMYPEYFEEIRNGSFPKIYTVKGNLVNVAYAEMWDKAGYGDSALAATIANQYAKTALFLKVFADEDENRRVDLLDRAIQLVGKSMLYAEKARPNILAIVDGSRSSESYVPHDAVVGLNQYAGALRYLHANDVKINELDHLAESRIVFDYSALLAQRNVPELVSFTALVDASTLVIAGSRDPLAVNEALEPILKFDTNEKKPYEKGVIARIINAKDQEVPEDNYTKPLDVYGKTNIASLANVSPDFRDWLTENGWVDVDFDLPQLFVVGL
jgi:hypothetical protein